LSVVHVQGLVSAISLPLYVAQMVIVVFSLSLSPPLTLLVSSLMLKGLWLLRVYCVCFDMCSLCFCDAMCFLFCSDTPPHLPCHFLHFPVIIYHTCPVNQSTCSSDYFCLPSVLFLPMICVRSRRYVVLW